MFNEENHLERPLTPALSPRGEGVGKPLNPTPSPQGEGVGSPLTPIASPQEAGVNGSVPSPLGERVRVRGLTPRLRFPDFRDAPPWEEKRLGDVADYMNGKSLEPYVSESGSYNLITLNSIDITGKLKTNHLKVMTSDGSLMKDDLVMVLSDVAHGDFLGLVDIIPDDSYVLNQRMGCLRIKNTDLVPVFFKTYINCNQKYFKLHGQGSSQKNLSKGAVLNFPISVPHTDEQRKIADCLTSLDEVITAQTAKLEALKAHKQALMQQLFPTETPLTPALSPRGEGVGSPLTTTASPQKEGVNGSVPSPLGERVRVRGFPDGESRLQPNEQHFSQKDSHP